MVRLPAAIAACLLLIPPGCTSPQVVKTTIITPTQRPDQMPVIPPAHDNAATRNCLTLGGTVTFGTAPASSLCALPGGAVIETSQLYAETHPGG